MSKCRVCSHLPSGLTRCTVSNTRHCRGFPQPSVLLIRARAEGNSRQATEQAAVGRGAGAQTLESDLGWTQLTSHVTVDRLPNHIEDQFLLLQKQE